MPTARKPTHPAPERHWPWPGTPCVHCGHRKAVHGEAWSVEGLRSVYHLQGCICHLYLPDPATEPPAPAERAAPAAAGQQALFDL